MSTTDKKFLDSMLEDIEKADIPDSTRTQLMKNLVSLKNKKINLMITGATGSGKSSTINALFQTEKAKVGTSVNPETMEIKRFELDNLVLWDSPGLGDGKEADNRHAKNIIKKLHELDDDGELLIDLVLVILDGGSKDLGTSYELINQVIIPNIGEDKDKRILVAINQCDVAMKGRYWDDKKNEPESKLVDFLEEKVDSVRKRIKEGTGVDIQPIYYKAGFKEEGMEQEPPYNLAKLLYYILQYTPKEKRLVMVDNLNTDEAMWKDNDEIQDYRKGILESFSESVRNCMDIGGEIGGKIGGIFGDVGEDIGRTAGEVGGALVGIAKEVVKYLPFPRFPWF